MKLEDFDYELPPSSSRRRPRRNAPRAGFCTSTAAAASFGIWRFPQLVELVEPRDVHRAERYARHQGAPQRPQSDRRQGGSARRTRAWRRRSARADAGEPLASRGRDAHAGRRREGERSAEARRLLSPEVRMQRCFRDARAPRRGAAAAVHRTRAGCATTKRATRPSMRVRPAQSRLRRPGFTSMRGCSIRCAHASVAIAYVTLHVGAGTFQPVRTDDVAEHEMHSEWYEVPQATIDAIRRRTSAGGRVLAVGTTTLRALEAVRAGRVARGHGRNEALHHAGLSLSE